MKNRIITPVFLVLSILFVEAQGQDNRRANKNSTGLDKQSSGMLVPEKHIFSAANSIPVRPGIISSAPFWNEKAVQFLYPPAFDVKSSKSAFEYRFTIVSEQNDTVTFKSDKPSEPLATVWSKIQVGKCALRIDALDNNGKTLEQVYSRSFHRAAEFRKRGPKMKIALNESVTMGLNALVHSPELSCWFNEGGIPSDSFIMYRYPSKMVGSAASVLAIYSMQNPAPADVSDAIQASKRAADYLLSLSFSKGDKWEFHPRTYHPTMYQKQLAKHKMDPDQYMTSYGGEVIQYYLDVYQATKEKKYLDASINIGLTYLKNQQTNGTWPLMVYGTSGKLVTKNDLVPTIVITALQKLSNTTGDKRFEASARKALVWVEENPVKTWNWQGQYEDVRPLPPYQNLTEHEACDFAIYLLQNFANDKKSVEIAQDLIRFSEDQFVIWGTPPVDSPTAQNPDGKQAKSSKWITPCVLEQYRCYAPVSASSAKMIRAFVALYKVTKEKLYLDKANALATSMVNLQQTPKAGGRYLTWIQKSSGQKWLNCELTTIKAMSELVNVNEK